MPRKSRIFNSAKGQQLKGVLEKKLDELNELLELNSEEREKIKNKKKIIALLESVSMGLYLETEKLCKKNPNLLATNLIVEQVNQVIKETKETIEDDPYIERLKEFVPAGENPEIQDVVIVLKQILQGLTRYKGKPDDSLKASAKEKDLMGILHTAITSLFDDNEELDMSDFVDGKYHSEWFNNTHPYYFNFSKLEETDLFDYFGYEDGEGIEAS
jgi:nitrate reductase NapAB chaperone NapD